MHISIPVACSDGKYTVRALNLSVEANSVLDAEYMLAEKLTDDLGCVISVELTPRLTRPGYDLISPDWEALMGLIEEVEPYYSRITKKVDRKGFISLPTAEELLNYGYNEP